MQNCYFWSRGWRMRRRRSSHGRLWLFQLRSECVGKFYQSLKNRGESELQKLNFNFGLIFWWLVNFTQEISYAFCQSLRFWVFTFEMWMYLHSKELYSLFVACVQQLLFSCRLCRWNFCQINLKYNYFFKLLMVPRIKVGWFLPRTSPGRPIRRSVRPQKSKPC